MQIQLKVCDLDECDFLQVKIEEYDFYLIIKDIFDISEPYKSINESYDNIIIGKTKENPKGVTISYLKPEDPPDKLSYLYQNYIKQKNNI